MVWNDVLPHETGRVFIFVIHNIGMISRTKACEILDAIESLDEAELSDDVYDVLTTIYDIMKQGLIDSLINTPPELPDDYDTLEEEIKPVQHTPAKKVERKVIKPESIITKDDYEQLKSTAPGRKSKADRIE